MSVNKGQEKELLIKNLFKLINEIFIVKPGVTLDEIVLQVRDTKKRILEIDLDACLTWGELMNITKNHPIDALIAAQAINPNESVEERVQRVIEESAKNSEFYQKEEKKRVEVEDRIRKLKLRIHHYKLHKRNWEVRS